ncbi:MAG TPA: phosphoglycerate mutase family protein [Longimicrobiales bacterium]|nr:phosphoglycerate mutase family protein [Longimicrobiales bacterium]
MWRRAAGAAWPVWALALALAACAGGGAPEASDAGQDAGATAPADDGVASAAGERLVVAVRHAEKVDASADPALSEAGVERAAALAAALEDAGIERVLSTDYIRTRDTALPTAEAFGLELEIYDPTDIPALADALRNAPESAILVVGHSNTTPALVAELTGEPAEPMPDAEYDRLYRVWIAPDGAVRAEVDRYDS